MIDLQLFGALVTYYFIMFATPGPNNAMLTASGLKFGFIRSIPNVLGIPTWPGLQLALVCLGLGSLFIKYPILFDVLRYVGSAYILYLAYKMFGSLNISKSEDRSRPLNYYEAILFQFVNPKAWVICSTAVTLYYPKNENILVWTLFMVIMSTIVNIPSISIWAYGGSIIRQYLGNEKLKKTIELLLAIMLIGTAVSVFFYNP